MVIKYLGRDKNVSIPPTINGEKVTKIGDNAFEGARSLYSITIPYGVTEIGRYAFDDCAALNKINLPDSVTFIDDYAFSDCNALTDISIPDSVTAMGWNCFMACRNLSSVKLSKSMTKIGGMSPFDGCHSLTNIFIPANITEVEPLAFYNCINLTSITVDPNNHEYTSIDGILFSKDKTKLVCYPTGKSDTSYSIPDNVTEIGGDAFLYCENLTKINIPQSVIKCADNVECENLTSINVDVNNPAFSSVDGVLFNKDKTKLLLYPRKKADKTYIIPNGITEIVDHSFYYCDNLINITMPDSVTLIQTWSFDLCINLTHINIPDNASIVRTRGGLGRYVLFNSSKNIQVTYKGKTYDYDHIDDLINEIY